MLQLYVISFSILFTMSYPPGYSSILFFSSLHYYPPIFLFNRTTRSVQANARGTFQRWIQRYIVESSKDSTESCYKGEARKTVLKITRKRIMTRSGAAKMSRYLRIYRNYRNTCPEMFLRQRSLKTSDRNQTLWARDPIIFLS